ncbi:MAG: CBS domain-containing protein [Phycisphaerae bacterium]|nr:CBS domain-containing protein [Phycisphaerae bacterium]NIR62434.1 CBS domain-containing protein [candidate division Zixibacteria bacterium]NIP55803.1 CBS domain-containing protein [Phycisphaerae bacterium]NIS50291.1 CBS domain-containing protein [Phycisphaerae bacterium]NIU08036.1 CBS domain-containing protein [Phycisphaerae bacterium]
MRDYGIDAYTPAQMAARVEKAGIVKGNLDFLSMFTLSVLAGAFIAFGAVLYTYVIHDSSLSMGLTKLLGGMVFCLGLILVIVAGAELFTGNNLIVMACVSRRITIQRLLRNWIIVFCGNFFGSLVVVSLVSQSGQWTSSGAAVGVKALMIANSKVNLTFVEALSRGILCNILVCLAVWLCFSCRSVADKVLAIIFPITAFVALGFEHSVANMYFVPAGLLLKQDPQVLSAAERILGQAPELSRLTVYGFLVRNLLPVTIGNIIGGGLLVGIIYWFVYLRRAAAEPVRKLMTKGPPVITPDKTVVEAVEAMKRHSVGSILVGESDDRAVGIVSEADIVRKVLAEGAKPDTVMVEEIMSSPLISVDVKTPIYSIYNTMTENRIRHLVITDQGQKVGFVSVKDLLRGPAS